MHTIASGDIHMAANACRNTPGIRQISPPHLTVALSVSGSRHNGQQVSDELRLLNPNGLTQFSNLNHPDINDHLAPLDSTWTDNDTSFMACSTLPVPVAPYQPRSTHQRNSTRQN